MKPALPPRSGTVLPALLFLLLAGPSACAAGEAAGPLARQEQQLRIDMAATATTIGREGDSLRLDYPARLAFAPDGATLLPAARAMLDILAASLRDHAGTQLVVAVYSDALGGPAWNQQQTQARAAAIVAYLAGRGVPAARLVARGGGATAPLPAPDTPEGRDLNRRVVMSLSPLSS